MWRDGRCTRDTYAVTLDGSRRRSVRPWNLHRSAHAAGAVRRESSVESKRPPSAEAHSNGGRRLVAGVVPSSVRHRQTNRPDWVNRRRVGGDAPSQRWHHHLPVRLPLGASRRSRPRSDQPLFDPPYAAPASPDATSSWRTPHVSHRRTSNTGGIHRIFAGTGSIPPVRPRSVCDNEEGCAEVSAP